MKPPDPGIRHIFRAAVVLFAMRYMLVGVLVEVVGVLAHAERLAVIH